MEDRRQRLLATIDGILDVARKWPDQMAAPPVRAALNELQNVRAAIAERQARVVPVRGMAHATSQTHTWADTLREDYLMVLASYAELHLTDESGKPLKLRVPHKSAGMGWLLKVARQFDPILRPHLPLLVEKGMRPDLLDKMHDAADQIAYWYHTRPAQRTQQKDLHGEVGDLISRGRRAIKLLGRELGNELRGNIEFATQFRKAATTSDKPGPARAVGYGTKLKRRERPASHAVPPERLSGVDTPAQDPRGPGPSGEATSQAE